MSRHTIAAGEVEVVLGWDPPMRTFFAQAWDRSLDEDDLAAELLWIGCGYEEITDPEHLCEAVAPWVKVPADLVGALYAEAHGDG